jgi:Ca2+-binding EF-hand superfamily protein
MASINPPSQSVLARGELEAKRLILLMDRDNSGMVSRDEYMTFMSAEFDRLDKNHNGELDVKELTQTHATGHPGR